VSAGAHKKFQRGQHTETYLLAFRAQYEGKMELSHDMVSFSLPSARLVAHPENLEKISKRIVGHWKNYTIHPAIHEYIQSGSILNVDSFNRNVV
jgi:hypothetical protein